MADGSEAGPVGVDVSSGAGKAPARRQPRRRTQGRSSARANTGGGTAGNKNTHKQIADALAKYGVMTTVLYSSYLASGMNLSDDEQSSAILTDEEAQAIADPIAKLIERSSVSKYAGAIVGGEDWMIAAAALFSYGQRVAPMQAAKRQQRQDRKPATERVSRPTREKRGNNGRRVPENATPDGTVVFGGAGPVTATPGGYGLGAQHTID